MEQETRTEQEQAAIEQDTNSKKCEKRDRFLQIPHFLPYFQGLEASQKLVLLALIEREDNFHLNEKGMPFFSTQEWLAAQLKMSIATITRNIKKLEKEGYIARYRKGFSSATTYVVNWDKLKELNGKFEFVKEETQLVAPGKKREVKTAATTQEPPSHPITSEAAAMHPKQSDDDFFASLHTDIPDEDSDYDEVF